MKRKPPEQPRIDKNLKAREWLDEYNAWEAAEQNKPINMATEKLFKFVNTCVTDPDFQKSPALLGLLLLVRYSLADEPRENWTLDDYLEPIVRAGAEAASKARLKRLMDTKDKIIKEWLAEPRGRIEREKFSDAMAKKYGLASGNIKKNYLSKKSIADYKARNSPSD